MKKIEHSLPAFYDKNSEILILGTMPSVRSREAGFYYMHPHNRFWRALCDVYREPFAESIAEKKALLKRRRIALFDVLQSCEITGSSDASIKNPKANDIAALLAKTSVSRVLVTGRTAERLYEKLCEHETGVPAEYLPSPSPANRALSYDRLVREYRAALIPVPAALSSEKNNV